MWYLKVRRSSLNVNLIDNRNLLLLTTIVENKVRIIVKEKTVLSENLTFGGKFVGFKDFSGVNPRKNSKLHEKFEKKDRKNEK